MEAVTPINLQVPAELVHDEPRMRNERPITVLVVDDARSNRQHVAQLLISAGLCEQTLFAEDGLQAFKILRTTPVDLVVCDLDMPRCDGLKFLHLKGTDKAFANIPVIVLTGAEDVARKVQALTAGASDYVVKPFDGSELCARIDVHLKVCKLQNALIAANAELQRLTLTDPLTEIANRRSMLQKLEDEYARARRYDRPLSFAILDIDHFKRVNDEYGHPAGDAVLVEVAALLTKTLRSSDTVARYGGEEFALILPETPSENAVLALDRMRSILEHHEIMHAGVRIPVTASFGIASFPHSLVTKQSDLIALADAALYDAKRSGRNRVVAAV